MGGAAGLRAIRRQQAQQAERQRIQQEREALQQEREQRVTREQQFQAGLQKGKELIGEGSLGRLMKPGEKLGRIETDIRQGRSEDIQEVIERRRGQLGGMTKEEESILRTRASEQIGRSEEMQRRRLAAIQAQAGVRGATAASQQLQVLTAGQKARTEFERDLALEQRRMQTEALGRFEQSVSAAEASEFQRQTSQVQVEQSNLAQQLREKELAQFDIAQRAREKFGQIGVAFGMTQMSEASKSERRAIEAQLAASQAASGRGK
jgi:hypothetical protein